MVLLFAAAFEKDSWVVEPIFSVLLTVVFIGLGVRMALTHFFDVTEETQKFIRLQEEQYSSEMVEISEGSEVGSRV